MTHDATDLKKWKNAALRALTRREHGRVELHDKLVARGADPQIALTVVEEMTQKGFLSDARFAESVVNSKAGRYGKAAIARKLQALNIESDVIDQALSKLLDRDEKEEAANLWKKKYDTPPQDKKTRDRQIRFLLSRGFPLPIVLSVVPRVFDKES
ncbi:MAG: recombination regulator RecX [Burkholderiales bacterium]|jgi:regulatory protein|nr:recombination regulator RecX [Burkholderiales bacterium]